MDKQATISGSSSQTWNASSTVTPTSSSNTLSDENTVAPPVIPPGKSDQQKKGRGHTGYIAIIVALVLIILTGGVFAAYAAFIHNPFAAASTPTVVQNSTPTTSGGITPTATVGATSTVSATSTNPTSGSNYSALQPGPGCDKNGGSWTPQGLSSITCGTEISLSTANIRGYMFLQLPNNKAFSSSNKIGVIGNPNYSSDCVGLDEQDANTGFLVEYCADGHWFIYTISPTDGSIVQTLDKNLTSTRSTVDISLALKGTTLTFSMDNETHSVNGISPIQPTKVAITYLANGSYYSIKVHDFSYTVLSS
jgi:hypothetical protein